MSPIVDQRVRVKRIGKISLGFVRTKTREDGSTVTFPSSSDTFVFTGDDEERMQEVARVFGGAVEPADAPGEEGGKWRVITTTKAVECKIIADDERGFDAWWELWNRSGRVRRCDGVHCEALVDEKSGEIGDPNAKGSRYETVECLCKANWEDDGAVDDRTPGVARGERLCAATSRLNVFVPALSMARGIGVWQVQSRGIGTYNEFASTTTMLKEGLGKISGIPLVLRADKRQAKYRDKGGEMKTKDVAVMKLDANLSAYDAYQIASTQAHVPMLSAPAPDRDAGPIGATTTVEGDPGNEPISKDDRRALFAYASEQGVPEARARALVAEVRGVPVEGVTTEGMTTRELAEVKRRIAAEPKAAKAGA